MSRKRKKKKITDAEETAVSEQTETDADAFTQAVVQAEQEDELIESALEKLRKERAAQESSPDSSIDVLFEDLPSEEFTTASLFMDGGIIEPEEIMFSNPLDNSQKPHADERAMENGTGIQENEEADLTKKESALQDQQTSQDKSSDLSEVSRYENQNTLTQPLLMEEAQEDRSLKTKEELRKKRLLATLLVAAIVIVLGGVSGYLLYSVYSSTEQIEEELEVGSMILLKDYAGRYDTLTQSEKLDLLDLESAYSDLSSEEKQEINAYYMEKTNQTFPELLNTLKLLKQNIENES